MFKDKILAELRKKYAGLSVQFLTSLAEKLAAKITEESAIEGAIAELENLPIPITDLAAEFQREGDRRATEAANKRESTLKEKYNFVDKKAGDPAPTDPPKPTGDPAAPSSELAEIKAWIQEMKQQQQAQAAAQTKEALLGKLKAKASEKKLGIPDYFFNGRVVDKEEDIDTVLDQINADYTTVKQHFIDQGMSESSIPLDGTGAAGGTGVSSMMSDYLKTKNPDKK